MIEHRFPRSRRLLHNILYLIALGVILALVNCRSPNPLPAHKGEAPALSSAPLSLIPAPYSLERSAGYFSLRKDAVLSVHSSNAEALGIASWFSDLVKRTRNLQLQVHPLAAGDASSDNGIDFVLDPRQAIKDDNGDEGYRLTVSATGITLAARTPHGLFNGATTLWQLLTLDGNTTLPISVPCLRIDDHPRFVWRGLMLDSARHFLAPEFVKQFIDGMALHKFNILHWHLTDDQGWRVEIKKYPKLTEVGAWRRPAGAAGTDANGKPVRYGGFYTQDQIRDIVRYAQQRHVTIVPEIEMPGHAQAAIAAYPQLGVSGKNPGVSHDWGVHTYLYNVEDSTFTFLQDVLSETMDLFPSKYIHIGGDEAAKDQWQASTRVQKRMRQLGLKDETALQSWFIHRIEAFLSAHGRELIGWDEILEGGLPPQATVLSWHGAKGAIEAAQSGHDVVISPDPDLYFDHLSGDLPDEPAGRPSVISLQSVYEFKLVPQELDAVQAKHVLGAQANLWSEYFPTGERVEYAAYPRATALAEVLWSPPATHDWHGFLDRLVGMQARYRQLGIHYAQSAFAVHIEAAYDAKQKSVQVKLSNQVDFGAIHYTLDGAAPTSQSPRYGAAFNTPANGEVRAVAFEHDEPLADVQARKLDPAALLRRNSAELAQCNPASGVILKLPQDAAVGASNKAYVVDIFDPCWIYQHADLSHSLIAIHVDRLPYNFQLWKDAKNIVSRKPTSHAQGELQVHLDRCDGELVAAIPLATALTQAGATTVAAPLAQRAGLHDLCLRFATNGHDPMWIIDWAEVSPSQQP